MTPTKNIDCLYLFELDTTEYANNNSIKRTAHVENDKIYGFFRNGIISFLRVLFKPKTGSLNQ